MRKIIAITLMLCAIASADLIPVRPWLSVSKAGMLTVHGDPKVNYEVQRSSDLVEWNHWTTTIGNSSCPAAPGFYRARIQ